MPQPFPKAKKRPSHDTLARRLSQILIKLNQGGKLDPSALAEEFCVDLRTIQRDLNQRFAYLPLIKASGRYHLDPVFLGKISSKDIQRFADLVGVRGLFPSVSHEFLRHLFDDRIPSALLIKGHSYEDLQGKEGQFALLEQAILNRRVIRFDYLKLPVTAAPKAYVNVEPYKLLNQKGIWYLMAKDGGKRKTFAFTKIRAFEVAQEIFVHDAAFEKKLQRDDGIWQADAEITVTLHIAASVAEYFKRRQLIANQVIERELEDGSLIVSAKVGHAQQVVPIVRYWIPHLRITDPVGMQHELEAGLKRYLSDQWLVDAGADAAPSG